MKAEMVDGDCEGVPVRVRGGMFGRRRMMGSLRCIKYVRYCVENLREGIGGMGRYHGE